MTTAPTIPNDWPANLTVEVVSPIAYLRVQAHKLTEMTGGVVIGEVAVTSRDEVHALGLEVVCPGLENAREELLLAVHKSSRPYPVRIESAALYPDDEDLDPERFEWPTADNYDELREVVRKILKSSYIVSLIQSLLARSNDAKLAAS